MCILQLREDGELCEVVRRHRRDVNRLELLAQLTYRPPPKQPILGEWYRFGKKRGDDICLKLLERSVPL